MLRPVLFVAGALAIIAPARAAEPELSGNYLLTYSPSAETEQVLQIVKIEVKDGKASISNVTPGLPVSGLEIGNGKTIKFKLNETSIVEGLVAADGTITGSYTSDSFARRAKMTKTEKTEIARAERTIKVDLPTSVAEANKVSVPAGRLRREARTEKDAEKKKELTAKAEAAQQEAYEKFKEVVEKEPGTAFALEFAMSLLQEAATAKLSVADAKKYLELVEKLSASYGPMYVKAIHLKMAEALAGQKGYDLLAVPMTEKLAAELTPKDPPARQVRILTAYKSALDNSTVPNKSDLLKTVTTNLNKFELQLDEEYFKKVPPFQPVTFLGRKDKAANQVAVMELFTGAQCPPCVAADVAFDALQKSYQPTELILIQYHLHIPGPDPLTNPDSVARSSYYSVRGTPSTYFNGKSEAGGGGGMANSQGKFKQYTNVIDPLLEKTTNVKVSGKAHQSGGKLDIAVDVSGAEGDDMKLRVLVVEESIRYVGSNGLRFHHQVVRAMPGGAAGIAIKDKSLKHSATVELANVRKGLTAYLDEYAASSAFPKPDRPLDLKNLRVIALVQNDKTKEILQALQMEVEGASTAGGGGQ